MRQPRRTRDDRGAAAVEFALLLPLFVILVFGLISGGIVFNDKLALTQGTREGARYGATLNGQPEDTTTAYTFLSAIRTQTKADTYGTMSNDSSSFCVGYLPPTGDTLTQNYYLTDSGTSVSPGTCPGQPAGVLPGSVVVVGQRPFSFNLILTSFGGTMQSAAVARYENQKP